MSRANVVSKPLVSMVPAAESRLSARPVERLKLVPNRSVPPLKMTPSPDGPTSASLDTGKRPGPIVMSAADARGAMTPAIIQADSKLATDVVERSPLDIAFRPQGNIGENETSGAEGTRELHRIGT